MVPQEAIAGGIYNLQSYYYLPAFNAASCKCIYTSPWDFGVVGLPCVYLAINSVLFFGITLLLQTVSTSMGGCLTSCFHRSPKAPDEQFYEQDPDVQQEMDFLDTNDLSPEENPIIVKHLRKVFVGRGNVSSKVAVRDVSFHVPLGEVFAYLGINGAGKTTSIAMLAGEFPPTSGEGTLAGLDIVTQRNEINRSMGYCPQFDALFPKMTGREHLLMYARIKGIPADQEGPVTDSMIHLMGLRDHCDREAGSYSGGNKRKLSVAISLLGAPKIVFLDEPSTGDLLLFPLELLKHL